LVVRRLAGWQDDVPLFHLFILPAFSKSWNQKLEARKKLSLIKNQSWHHFLEGRFKDKFWPKNLPCFWAKTGRLEGSYTDDWLNDI